MNTPVTSSRHLSAFGIDIDHELEQTGLFSRIKIKKTGLPSCALRVVCSLADGSINQSQVASTLERIWVEALDYGEGKGSYHVTMTPGEVQMSFTTSIGEARVTGRIEVVGFK